MSYTYRNGGSGAPGGFTVTENQRAHRLLAATTAAVLLLGTTACGDDDERDTRQTTLAAELCDTELTTAPIKKLFPGPYTEAYQHFSSDDSLHTLKKGRKSGECMIGLVYDDRYGMEQMTDIHMDAWVSNDETAEELVQGSEKFGLPVSHTVQSGAVAGVTGREGAAVAFPCEERTDQARSVRVRVDFVPDELDITQKRKRLIATTSGRYAVRVSRYLNEEFLGCLDPADLSGPIHLRRSEDQQQ